MFILMVMFVAPARSTAIRRWRNYPNRSADSRRPWILRPLDFCADPLHNSSRSVSPSVATEMVLRARSSVTASSVGSPQDARHHQGETRPEFSGLDLSLGSSALITHHPALAHPPTACNEIVTLRNDTDEADGQRGARTWFV